MSHVPNFIPPSPRGVEFPTLDVRYVALDQFIRHIEPWEPIVLSADEVDVLVTPCRCVTVEKGKLGATD